MDAKHASLVITQIADSLEKEPDQFNVHVSVKTVGQHIVSYGGTGLSITATGGAAGSRTTGQVVRAEANNQSIEISRSAGRSAFDAEAKNVVAILRELAGQLKEEHPDASKVSSRWELLKAVNWIPPVITNVVGTLIAGYIAAH